jgi:O-succinylbenzoate synthase
MKATYFKHKLQFKQASGTSRGVLTYKDTWFIELEENALNGIGECGMFKGLSIDDCDDFELMLKWACQNIDLGLEALLRRLVGFPSIQFGLEIAFRSLKQKSPFELFPSDFTS